MNDREGRAMNDGIGRESSEMEGTAMPSLKHSGAADRWMQEQLFEEDVRAVLNMMRPHRRERLAGWSEYRTGGANFRVTISWDEDFAQDEQREREAERHEEEMLRARNKTSIQLPSPDRRVTWKDHPGEDATAVRERKLCVPQMAKVLETILVGSARDGDELLPQEEFALYRAVAEELKTRIDELENCYT